MQHNWTDPSTRPSKLYRIIHPRSSTRYDPTHGFLSPVPDTKANYITSIPQFLSAITSHRNQDLLPHGGSPFISTFEDLEEAESWAIAAEDIFGGVAYVVAIDVKSEAMREVKMWKVGDVQDECGQELGGRRREGGMGVRDSEWLVLYRVPGVAMRIVKTSEEIRKERDWKDDGFHAVYAGAPMVDEYEPLGYKPSDLLTPMEWTVWEKCWCESKAVCCHAGPFHNPMKPKKV